MASRTGAPISAVGLGEALPCRLRAVPCPGSCRRASLGRVHLPWHHCPELRASCCVGVPSAGDPPARAACAGSSHTAASAGSSALLPYSVCPVKALGTAQGSIKVWLSCSCVLLWGRPLGWRDAAPLSSARGWALAGRWVLSLPSAARTQMSGGGWRCAPSLVHASGRCRFVCGASSPGCGSAPWVTSAMALAGQPLATRPAKQDCVTALLWAVYRRSEAADPARGPSLTPGLSHTFTPASAPASAIPRGSALGGLWCSVLPWRDVPGGGALSGEALGALALPV